MGFLDRFKKQKEKEVENAGATTKAADEALKKAEKSAEDKPGKAGSGSAGKEEKKKQDKKAKKEKKAGKNPAEKKTRRDIPLDISRIIIKPLVSEKTATQSSAGKYTFMVDNSANRIQVRNAVKAIYGVQPISVNIMNIKSKNVRFGRIYGKQKAWKKATVTLPKGKQIDVYEGV